MQQTFGSLLDDQQDWFSWLNRTWTFLAVLRMLSQSRLLDHIGDEPISIEALSAAAGMDADRLARVINFLAAHEILELTADGTVAHTSRSRNLVRDSAVVGVAMHSSQAGTRLADALQQGVTPYELHFGKPCFEHLAEQPEIAKVFASLMSFMTTLVNRFVFSEHRFEPFTTAVDVGGSHGELLLELLQRHPDSSGVLFDLPDVTAMVAESVQKAPAGDRVEIVAGDFFESVPAADLYLLKMILHDWSDAESVRILQTIRQAIQPGGRVIVIDHVMPETPQPSPANSMDIAMMIWANGRERKRSEMEALFAAAGFRLDRVTENPAGPSVLEAVIA